MTAPNAELAYRVLDHIDAHPRTWDQRSWQCGSSYCFGGWAVVLSGATTDPDEEEVISGPEKLIGLNLEDAAYEVLGLSSTWGWVRRGGADDEWLFASDNTRADLGRLVAEIFGPRPAPAPAAPGPYGVADYRQPLTDFERRAGVIEPDLPPNAGSAS